MKPHKKQNLANRAEYAGKKKRKHRISETSLKEDSPASDKCLNRRNKKKKMRITKSEDHSPPTSVSHSEFKGVRKLQLLQANKEEDKHIRQLEKMLGVNKRKRKKHEPGAEKIRSILSRDGLDLFLKPLDASDSEEDNLGIINNSSADYVLHTDSDSSQDSAEESEKSVEGNISDDNVGEDFESQSAGGEETDEESCEPADASAKESKAKIQKPEIWEDIYGRLRDREGNVLSSTASVSQTTYVPPHLREKQEPVSDERQEALMRIKKQLKGLINRLSESNMNRISNEVEKMYMKNSRNDMNETLMSILSEILLSPVAVPPRFVLEQSMLIALLHGNIGSEIGAFFLQNLSLKFEELFKADRSCEQGKECHNVLTFLCHLYNFKVTHSLLIFDILRLLVESFQEMDIELILLILKHAGFSLRKDDPLAFKEILLSIQSKAAALKPEQNQSRVNFMLDILIEVRNNNRDKMKKLLNYDSSAVEQLKKLLRTLAHKGSYSQELSISYADLLKAHEQGRWWIVGSAWSQRTSENVADVKNDSALEAENSQNSLSDKIIPLAKKLRINTETRKIVFNAIMTAENYMDAFENLLHLKLKNQQEREIISVLLHCSLHEKIYNPFYAHLASKLCAFDRRFREHMKFCLWDRFKELKNMKPSQRNCLTSLLVHLFTTESLDISVLKVIQYADMNKTIVQFLKKILTPILLHNHEEVCHKVFLRCASNSNLNLFRDSLRIFMYHFILRKKSEMDVSVAEKLTQRVKMAEDALNSAKHAFKL